MVFCKLSKNTKNRLSRLENVVETSSTNARDIVNSHIEQNLKSIDDNKRSIADKISKKLEEKKQQIRNNIIAPHEKLRQSNKATMFYVDVCLSLVAGIFVYKMFPSIKKFFITENYTKKQYNDAMKLPENSYSREDLQKVQEFKKSFQDWMDYYKAEDAFSDYNLGTTEIRRGNDLREPIKFVVEYFIPYVILAYIAWFIIKYFKYVLAAIWGFFVTLYQFTTEKITCKLAEKWYIRLATGWSRCNPNFGVYVDAWKNQYITRPIAEERINYLKGVETVKVAYKQGGYKWPFSWLGNWIYDFWYTYVELPTQELYLQLIQFHPTYVVYPYDILTDKTQSKIKEQTSPKPYSSKTKSGKVCKCPPKKTVYTKLNCYLKKSRCKISKASRNTKNTISDTTKNIQNIRDTTNRTIDNIKKDIPSISSCKNVETKTKRAAQGIWTILMIITTGVIVYSLMYKTPKLIDKIFDPVYNFTDSYIPSMALPNRSMLIIAIYFSTFISLGLYGFVF
jgi:hypothetical protein